jgi:hypothetical protein
MEMQSSVREEAARAMHWAVRQAMEHRGPAADQAWLAVTYIQEALASEGFVVVRKGQTAARRR